MMVWGITAIRNKMSRDVRYVSLILTLLLSLALTFQSLL